MVGLRAIRPVTRLREDRIAVIKSECHSCGDYTTKPLSWRNWCQDCEAEAQAAHYQPEVVDEILRNIRG